MKDMKTITLRCKDNLEAAVFTKYTFSSEDTCYEFNVEDCYTGGDYRGILGRFKRAWKAFINKPVIYTGIYCEDRNELERFLTSCLNLLREED